MTLVMTNGCLDILHCGHIRLLRRCYELAAGGPVVVAIDTDERVRSLKGPTRPVNTFEHRREVLLAIRYVSHVVGFDSNDGLLTLINTYRPAVLVQGPPVREPNPLKVALLAQWGGRVEYMPVKDDSSTRLIEAM